MKKIVGILFIVLVICLVAYVFQAVGEKNDQRVMAFGDSLTYGKGDQEGEGYIDDLKQKTNDSDSDKKVQFWNYGIKGQETDGVINQLEDTEINTKLDKADTFIVYIGINDLINSNGGNLKKIHDQKINDGKKEYVEHIDTILSLLLEKNTKADILVIGLYNPNKEDMKLENHINNYNSALQERVDKDNRLKYIPTNDLFQNKDKEEYFSDEIHPNEKGYQLITNRILDKYNFK
ncbi:GDSL-type esterase/lipase family protein [Peribacillus sp. NPDC097295]|uniref:DUF459 domain-containing protein n=1 Tax=Peribacillus sp. NPDC097295 TaxID=3364402 RepID=UPI0038154C5D